MSFWREMATLSDRCRYCEVPLRSRYWRWIGMCVDCIYRMERGAQPLTPEMRGRKNGKTTEQQRWQRKQELAGETGARYYGNGGTIHGTTQLDVETDADGNVVAVWFRCQQLPYRQTRVDDRRVREAGGWEGLPRLTGVELIDPEG